MTPEEMIEDYPRLVEEHKKLKEELSWIKRQLFGRKSERFIPEDNGQLGLFAEPTNQEPSEKEEVSYTRNKPRKDQPGNVRPQLPGHLRREEETIEPEVTSGKKIGEEVTEVLEYVPAELFVRRIVRPKYALPDDQGVSIADLPDLPIPRSNAGPGLLAQINIAKFMDHLPLYRQLEIFKRDNIAIASSTFNGWVQKSIELLVPLYDALVKELLQTDYLMADETPLKVLDTDKKKDTHKGYHWVYEDPVKKLVCFQYRKGRGREGPKEFLKEFNGALQSDGYAVYDKIAKKEKIKLLACLAHVRRKFEQAKDNHEEIATYALKRIGELYAIERTARKEGLSFEQRKDLRRRKAAPILNELEEWMQDSYQRVTPKSSIGKALSYGLKLWDRIKTYLEDGRYEIDNNMVENAIRPVALGRKNYLFAGSHEAAQRAAIMYSLLGTCKKNNVNPFEWLKDVLSRINAHPINRIEELLPHRWEK